MADYIITNGQLHTTDELMHWKYIKKVKGPNGKWRYIYDIKDAMGYDERERMNAAAANEKAKVGEFIKAQKALDQKNKGHLKYNVVNDKLVPADKETSEWERALVEKGKAETQYNEAIKAFYKTPLGQIKKVENAIFDGKVAIKDFFKKLSNKSKKKK